MRLDRRRAKVILFELQFIRSYLGQYLNGTEKLRSRPTTATGDFLFDELYFAPF